MSVNFTISEFFMPADLLRFRFLFRRSQWYSPEKLEQLQIDRLKAIFIHAKRHVPYYREKFAATGFDPAEFRTLAEVRSLPVLTRNELRENAGALTADNRATFNPSAVRTSGSSGEPAEFLLDRRTGALEFNYYWRYWNWSGYALGDQFAEFSSDFFMRRSSFRDRAHHAQPITGRVLLNSLYFDEKRVRQLHAVLREKKCRFLKGLPSVIAAFIVHLKRASLELQFDVVFTTGEVLQRETRRDIESAFHAKVRDSYGHMERAVAASECELGRLHINQDYGLMELVPEEPAVLAPAEGLARARIIGTGLYNFSMPLIRYDTGDIAIIDQCAKPCSCGRYLPVIERVEGRANDVIRTPGGKIVTTLFLAFNDFPDVVRGQFIQDRIDHIVVRGGLKDSADRNAVETRIREYVNAVLNEKIQIDFDLSSEDAALGQKGKFRSVVSLIGS